jgi:alpha-glucosidase
MYVVYDSPLVMLADSPDSYIDAAGRLAPGADFLKQVPTSWDETRFLAGEVGEYIVLARRKGDTWYIGAMTNEQARTIRVPLDMLEKGRRWSVRTWQDGAGMNDLRTASATMASGAALTLKLAASGGAAVTISPDGGR